MSVFIIISNHLHYQVSCVSHWRTDLAAGEKPRRKKVLSTFFDYHHFLSVVICRWNRSQTRTKILGRFVTKRGPFRALAFNKNKNKPCKLYWFPLSTSKHRARWSYSDAFWMWLAFYKSTVHPNDETSGLPIIYPAVFEPLMCLSQLPTQLSSCRVVSRIVFIIMLAWSWFLGFYLSHHLHGYIRSSSIWDMSYNIEERRRRRAERQKEREVGL